MYFNLTPIELSLITTTIIAIAYYFGKYHGRMELTEKIVSSMLKTLEQGGFIKTRLDKNGDIELIEIDKV